MTVHTRQQNAISMTPASRRARSWRSPVVLAAGSLLIAGMLPALASVAAAAAVTPAAAPATQLTPDQALVQAHRTGKPVDIPGSTTDTTTITAEPNGSFPLPEAPATGPQRG